MKLWNAIIVQVMSKARNYYTSHQLNDSVLITWYVIATVQYCLSTVMRTQGQQKLCGATGIAKTSPKPE